MGLDNFWRVSGEQEGVVEGSFNICGGMFSGSGNSSFRGKVYNSLVEKITGVSLYQEEIPSNVVKEMADKLEEQPYNGNWEHLFGINEDEYKDLVGMFVKHAEEDHYLVGWW
jgi:hypothetical protein